MKMVVHGTGKVEKILVIMDTDIVGLGWEANLVMVPQNGKKLYVFSTMLF